jgi:hypothetical protein
MFSPLPPPTNDMVDGIGLFREHGWKKKEKKKKGFTK